MRWRRSASASSLSPHTIEGRGSDGPTARIRSGESPTVRNCGSPPPRQFFTVDLRGLRSPLAARAASAGMTESDVLRSALANALGEYAGDSVARRDGEAESRSHRLKLSLRLTRAVADRLEQNAQSAGLSRGAYLTRLIDGAPPIVASSDRLALSVALKRSSGELAVLSRDINHLERLLSVGSVEAAKGYRERLRTLDTDVREHLRLAALALAELVPARNATQQSFASTARHSR